MEVDVGVGVSLEDCSLRKEDPLPRISTIWAVVDGGETVGVVVDADVCRVGDALGGSVVAVPLGIGVGDDRCDVGVGVSFADKSIDDVGVRVGMRVGVDRCDVGVGVGVVVIVDVGVSVAVGVDVGIRVGVERLLRLTPSPASTG